MNRPLKPSLRIRIQSFIREVLGCTCPDAVFQTVRIDKNPRAFAGLERAYAITVGGRLLVLVVLADELPTIMNQLGEILERGRRLRDCEGLNRFRLVVATPDPQAAQPHLAAHFESLGYWDERLHLHVVAADQLPAIES